MALKKISVWTFLLVVICFVGLKACEHDFRRSYAEQVPEPIKLGKALVFAPNCSFGCSGGAIYRLDEVQAEVIDEGGLEYLNSFPKVGRNGSPIGTWKLYNASNIKHHPLIWDEEDRAKVPGFYEALVEEECYVSNRHEEPLLIVCPKARFAHVGWFD